MGSPLLSFLSSSPLAVAAAAVLILLAALWGYWQWFRPVAMELDAALASCTDALASASDDWPATKERVASAASSHPAVRDAWQETLARIVSVPRGEGVQFVTIGAPRDVWSARILLSRSVNVALAEAVPNLLVGVGLLFTFFFLTIALMHATDALFAQAGENQNVLEATRGLLSAAGAKFLTSLAGLLASIVWTIGMRRRLAALSRASDRLLEQFGRAIPSNGGEVLAAAQFDAARDLGASTHDHVELTTELLEETREQTGTFKRFETDLAVSLAGAITQAFTPQMEAMTNRLIESIDSLSGKLGLMNQEALERMTRDFAALLKQGTESEMAQLRTVLSDLATNLSNAGERLGQGTGEAAEKLSIAGAELLERVGSVSEALSVGAQNLGGAAQSVKETVNDLDAAIDQVAELGKQGADFFKEALATSEGVVERLKGVSEKIGSATDGMDRVAGRLADVVDSVDELAKEQRAVVAGVQEAVPETLDAFRQTRESLASAATALGRSIASITEGVSEYSKMVAALHGKMDEQMARAVGSLDRTVASLDESFEELVEALDRRDARV